MLVLEANRFADTAFNTITNNRSTMTASDYDATSSGTLTSGRNADRQSCIVMVASMGAHSLEVRWSTQAILPFHRSARSLYDTSGSSAVLLAARRSPSSASDRTTGGASIRHDRLWFSFAPRSRAYGGVGYALVAMYVWALSNPFNSQNLAT